MGNYGVYVTVKNKTHETLRYGWSSQASGKWKDMPSAIKANKDASFSLEDTDWFTGTEGAFSYSINDDQKLITSISLYQTDPYAHDNVIAITDLPHPEAVYSLSYRSSVNDDKHWQDNQVSPDGHPLYIEYTIDYERKKHYRFQLLQITANSDHPVRNSRNRTVVGSHTLWDPSNSNKDGTVGSYEPNVFAYDFKSLVTETGFVNVKVQPMDPELSGAEVILIGSIGGKELLKSDYFFFKGPNQPITVTAHVVGILTSDHPFSLNGDVDWSVHLRQSDEKLQRYGDGVTRLELYWIAKNRHRAFNDFLPINFLRLVLKADQLKGTGAETEKEREGGKLVATFTYWYQQKTNEVFDAYNKQYDVFNGASHFNVTLWGGNFWLTRYTDGGGASNPIVNCMDQAGMLELACSLYTKATSWLCVQPFGYINQTHLVGIKDYHGTFYEINNPFFGNNPDRALVPPDANDRQAFRCHAFNGDSLTWTNSSNQGVYDACGGPHAGTRNIVDYLDNDIDRTTPLYQRYPLRCPWPATAGEVIKAVGVEAIDGPPIGRDAHQHSL
ncbi:hypothetical protein H0H93_009624 [Arthromyces matolae]|nr:hypothetical protein H0H93_009624 [Arthromyces matolae]